MLTLSDLLNNIAPSSTIAIGKLARELRAQGKDVISLSQGEPDFNTPKHICDAAIDAIHKGFTRYTDVDGMPDLKAAIIDKFKRENGLDYTPKEITVGTGGKQVIYNALMATLNAGDEVLIPAPYWVSYPDMVKLAGGNPVKIVCAEKNSFKLTAKDLRAAITQRTKWLILNSPSNPTGVGYNPEDLEALAAVLRDFPNVCIMSDDMYEHIRFGDWQFTSFLSVAPDLKERTLTVNGVSKAYCMTGWRIGYAGGPAPLIAAMSTIQSQSTSNPCSIAQAAALAALKGPLDFVKAQNALFEERRDIALNTFNSIDGLSCISTDGAFYLYPSCAGMIGRKTPDGKIIETDIDFVNFLLEHAHVAVVPGAAFGLAPYFRISFAIETERLKEACQRIVNACNTLQH